MWTACFCCSENNTTTQASEYSLSLDPCCLRPLNAAGPVQQSEPHGQNMERVYQPLDPWWWKETHISCSLSESPAQEKEQTLMFSKAYKKAVWILTHTVQRFVVGKTFKRVWQKRLLLTMAAFIWSKIQWNIVNISLFKITIFYK